MNLYTTFTGVAFKNGPRETVDVSINECGTVRVWDSAAKAWSVCHALTAAQEKRLTAKAIKEATPSESLLLKLKAAGFCI